MIDPVRPIAIEDIEQARERIAGTVLRTPLVRLDLDDRPDIRLKLENLQPTNAYKIRGATNAVARLSDEERAQGRVDDQCRQCGAGRRLCGASVRHSVQRSSRSRLRRKPSSTGCGRSALRSCRCPTNEPGSRRRRMNFLGSTAPSSTPSTITTLSPDMATMGLEILEDLPEVRTVICAIGGGGLITGVGSAIKAKRPT